MVVNALYFRELERYPVPCKRRKPTQTEVRIFDKAIW
jgi:hypothetical protein